MASIFKKDRRKGAPWYIDYTDEAGRRLRVKGCGDRGVTDRIARKLESDVELRRRGVIDARDDARVAHAARPLAAHLDAFRDHLTAKGATAKHAGMAWERARRVVALAKGAALASIVPPRRIKAADLAGFVAAIPPGSAVFPLPDKGAAMLRRDLAAAGIPYRDDAGQVFDFHSLRCQCATLADAAGVSARVVQRMTRHSTLELTGRYTRPRVADLDAAADALPSLAPREATPEVLAATGTDPAPSATASATVANADASGLGEVVAAWPDLAEPIRAGILAMIRSASGKGRGR